MMFIIKDCPLFRLCPSNALNTKKAIIKTNMSIESTKENGLTEKSIADCLQTRPIDYRLRLKKVRGKLSDKKLDDISYELRIVFDLM